MPTYPASTENPAPTTKGKPCHKSVAKRKKNAHDRKDREEHGIFTREERGGATMDRQRDLEDCVVVEGWRAMDLARTATKRSPTTERMGTRMSG